jgi:NADH dehydrogenase
MRIFLTGGTGFVGRHMIDRLLSEGHTIRALVRDPGKTAQPQAGVEWIAGDVVEGSGLENGIDGCEAVIHLVGIIVEKGKNTFERVHHMGTRNVVQAARHAGIRRFIHMSALGVRPDGVAAYQTSKWRGEQEVRQSGIPWCILRPSLIFGPGDGFVTQMIETMRAAPLMRPVPGDGSPWFKPIYIGDVTACFARALVADAATNHTIALCGADELSLDEVLAEIARCAGVRKPAVHIPLPLMFTAAFFMERLLRNPPVTTDQLRMLREGSRCSIEPMVRILGVQPRGFTGCGRESAASELTSP